MFACDILRGSGAQLMVAEADRLQSNMQTMDPPPFEPLHATHPPPAFDSAAFFEAMLARAAICFNRGVSLTVTHFTAPTNVLPDWQDAMGDIAEALQKADPVAVADPIVALPENVPAAVGAWQAAGGGPELTVPVRFK